MEDNDEEEYFVPLQDQRVFGAGIKRKRVQFVRATLSSPQSPRPLGENEGMPKIGDYYLSMVLSDPPTPDTTGSSPGKVSQDKDPSADLPTCEICKLPLDETDPASLEKRPHDASLAHQVCLSHSHPPSHLDRHRKGLQYLASYGWDPDSRLGLGASGEGTRIPVKGTPKADNLGVGLRPRKEKGKSSMKKNEINRLHAGEVRKMEAEGKKRSERLHEMFYRSEDLERYLGPAA